MVLMCGRREVQEVSVASKGVENPRSLLPLRKEPATAVTNIRPGETEGGTNEKPKWASRRNPLRSPTAKNPMRSNRGVSIPFCYAVDAMRLVPARKMTRDPMPLSTHAPLPSQRLSDSHRRGCHLVLSPLAHSFKSGPLPPVACRMLLTRSLSHLCPTPVVEDLPSVPLLRKLLSTHVYWLVCACLAHCHKSSPLGHIPSNVDRREEATDTPSISAESICNSPRGSRPLAAPCCRRSPWPDP